MQMKRKCKRMKRTIVSSNKIEDASNRQRVGTHVIVITFELTTRRYNPLATVASLDQVNGAFSYIRTTCTLQLFAIANNLLTRFSSSLKFS
jgi:hypothetical protein